MKVAFTPRAEADLSSIYDYIAKQSGSVRARRYTLRIEKFCRNFSKVPRIGTVRDDIRPGLRTVGFEGRILIAFHIKPDRIIIDQIRYGGRQLD